MDRFKLYSRLLLFFLLLSIECVQGQTNFPGIPYIRNYSRLDYNSSPFNWGVVQDTRGVIYVANNYHVLEFDGNTWRSLPLPNRTVIRSLAIDKKGTVYVGGQADFGYLQPDEKGQVTFVSLKSKIKESESTFADVWKILVTEHGIAFCTSAGIYYLENDAITFYKINHEELGFITFFYISQRIFLCSQKQGILELKNNEFVKVPQSEQIGSKYIVGMLEAPGNRILVVTQQEGIFSYDGYSSFEQWHFDSEEFLKNNQLACAAVVPKGYLIGSSQNGLIMIGKDGKTLMHLNKQKGLQNNGVEFIYPDNNGNVWLALRDGVDYIEINSPFSIFNARSQISGAGFTSAVHQGNLYLGTSDGLYTRSISNGNGIADNHTFTLVEGTQGQTYNLQTIGDKLLLSHNNGAYVIDGAKATRLGEQSGVWIFLPMLNRPGYLLCGTYTGLSLYKLQNGIPVYQWKVMGFEESARIMEQDAEGNVWIAHGYLGLFKVKLSDDLQSAASVDFYNSKNGFPSNVFINVFKVNNELVFTAERGIYSYNKLKDTFEPNEVFNALINKNNHTRKLIEDNEGNIWYSSADELGILKKRNGRNYEVTKTIFNKLQRRLVGGFEHIAYYDSHNVIIGTDDGFVHFDPSFVFNNDHSFTTLVRKVESTNELDSVLSAGQNNVMEARTLNYDQNSLRFSFSASSYEDASKVQYQYKLEGYDENWSPWTTFTSKEYTNLREGNYKFTVKSRDIYNREGTTAAYAFTITPPWYRTVPAYIVYALMIIASVYGISKFSKYEQQKSMKLREIQHQDEVLRAEKEIIKLNNEKLENELAHKNKELASSAMHIVHNVEAIQRIKTSLISAIDVVQDNEAKVQMRKLLRSIASEMTLDNNWEQFEHHFNQIHQDFIVRLRREFPELTHSDIKLISYLKLNLSSKEIAPLLNLTVRGVEASRYRIRKKMNLSPNVNLTEFILKY